MSLPSPPARVKLMPNSVAKMKNIPKICLGFRIVKWGYNHPTTSPLTSQPRIEFIILNVEWLKAVKLLDRVNVRL